MELIAYDVNMTPLGAIDEITSLVWIRRYQTCGEFNLLVPFSEQANTMLADGNLLMKRGGNECMQICYKNLSKNAQGMDEIEIQGRTLLGWLERRVLLAQIVAKHDQTGQQLLLRHITENITAPTDIKRTIPRVFIYPRNTYADEPLDYQSEEYANVRDSFEMLMTTAKLGFRAITSSKNGTHAFDVFRGRDLTSSSETPCIFSVNFDNLGEQRYTHSSENLRTTAYVIGTDQNATVGGEVTGLGRREISVTASDIAKQYTDENGQEVTLTDAQVQQALLQRGAEELEQYLEEHTFEGVIHSFGSTQYGIDFDIGDRVTCIYKRWGVQIDVTITEIVEEYQENKNALTVTFGEGMPSLEKKFVSLSEDKRGWFLWRKSRAFSTPSKRTGCIRPKIGPIISGHLSPMVFFRNHQQDLG